jgi:peptidyl-prolyl cis-trans isomerase SurA
MVLLCIASLQAKELVDGIAAVVGDSVILVSELRAYTTMSLKQQGIDLQQTSIDEDTLQQLQRRYLDELIRGKVLIVHAQRDSMIQISEERVDNALQRQIQTLLQQEQMDLPEFENLLRRQYNTTLDKYKAQLRQGIKRQFVQQAVIQTYLPSLSLTRDDVRRFYQTYKDSFPSAGKSVHVSKLAMVPQVPDSVRDKAYSRMVQVKKKLQQGMPFAEAAREYSRGPNRENGGTLGYVAKGTLSSPVFEEKAFALSPGEVSDIFETQMGFHIVKVRDKRENEIHVSQIMIPVEMPQEAQERTRAVLDSIRTHCKTREGFARAVERFSQEEISKARKGEIGWQSVYELPQQLSAHIDSLGKGDMSPIIREADAYVLYRINDKVQDRRYTLEDDWDLLAQKAREIYTQKKLQELVSRWRREMYIDIRL